MTICMPNFAASSSTPARTSWLNGSFSKASATRTLEGGGLRPTARADYNVLWQKKFLNPFQMRSLHPQQRVNHFPGMNFLTFKDQLVHTVRAASARALAAASALSCLRLASTVDVRIPPVGRCGGLSPPPPPPPPPPPIFS